MKPALYALAFLTVLSACQRREEADAPPATPHVDPQVTEADQAAPLTYARETAYAEVSLTLPREIIAYPDLHASIYGQEVGELREFVEGAQGDHTEFTGEEGLPPYERTVVYEPAGETPRLFSLRESAFEYLGGAHGLETHGGVLWDRTADRRLEPSALFGPGADLGVLDRALCEAINRARTARMGGPSALVVGAPNQAGTCPRALQTPFVLAPSTTEGRAGGLEFLIGPYRVGAYAEGSYHIVVPQAVFRSLLDPAFAGEFAGAPRRAGDVTPREPVTEAR